MSPIRRAKQLLVCSARLAARPVTSTLWNELSYMATTATLFYRRIPAEEVVLNPLPCQPIDVETLATFLWRRQVSGEELSEVDIRPQRF